MKYLENILNSWPKLYQPDGSIKIYELHGFF